jgi:hypothetical protein
MIGPFIKCPFCSGHEAVSEKAVNTFERLIYEWLQDHNDPELENIRNVILNTQERKLPIDPLLT